MVTSYEVRSNALPWVEGLGPLTQARITSSVCGSEVSIFKRWFRRTDLNAQPESFEVSRCLVYMSFHKSLSVRYGAQGFQALIQGPFCS